MWSLERKRAAAATTAAATNRKKKVLGINRGKSLKLFLSLYTHAELYYTSNKNCKCLFQIRHRYTPPTIPLNCVASNWTRISNKSSNPLNFFCATRQNNKRWSERKIKIKQKHSQSNNLGETTKPKTKREKKNIDFVNFCPFLFQIPNT